MKKIYTLVAALGFVSSLFAQNTGNQTTRRILNSGIETGLSSHKRSAVASIESSNFNSNQSVNGVKKAILYTSNFSAASEWVVGPGSTGTPYGSWSVKTTPTFTSQGGSSISRPTSGTGNWLLMDIDALTNGGSFSETVVSTATFSTLGEYALQIKFRQRFTSLNDDCKVLISTDNGAVWNEVAIAANDAVSANSSLNTGAATFITVDISSIASNAASVRIGFKYSGTTYGYWWGIDDVSVESRPPSNELSIVDFYPVYGGYTKVPYDFSLPTEIEVGYKNVGGSSQNNVVLTSKINTSLYSAVDNQSLVTQGTTNSVIFTPTASEVPVLGLGVFTYTASVTADETELTPANNFKSFNQQITTNSYSLDDNNTIGSLNATFIATNTPIWAANYFVFGNYELSSVDFVVSNTTTVGSVVEVQVYQIPSSWDATMATLITVGSPVTHTITAGEIPAATGINPTTVNVNLSGATGNAPSGAFILVSVKYISGNIRLPYKFNTNVKPGEALYSTSPAWVYALTTTSTFAWFNGGDLFGSTVNLYIRPNFVSSCVALTGQITSSTPATCAAANGSVNVTNPTSGTGPYEFLWYTNPKSTDANTTGLTAGTYDLLVTDVTTLTTVTVGCPTQGTATVAFNNTIVNYTKTITQPTCVMPNGVINISGATGTAPFNYAWTPTSAGNTATINGLAPGSYTLNITDANGCFGPADLSVLANVGVPSTFTLSQVASTSCASADGSATVATNLGPALATYTWSPSSNTGVTATGLTGGTNYTLTAINTDNCSSSKSIVVNATGAPTPSATVISTVSCNGGNNGAFNITLSPATAGYTFSVNAGPASATTSITGLTAGTYTVTGTNGSCNVSTSAVINQALTAMSGGSTTITNVNCNSATTGSIAVSAVTGGTGAYNYSWTGTTTGGPQASSTIGSLGAGTYNVVVKDANNCVLTPALASAIVSQPATAVSFTANSVINTTGAKRVSITVSGGTPPYTITALQGASPVTVSGFVNTAGTRNITLSVTGDVNLTITDSKNCSSTVAVTAVGVKELSSVSNLAVYPNPTENNVTISFNSTEAKNVTVKLVSLNGQEIFTQELPQFVGEYSKTVNMSTQAQGVYFLQIVSDKNVTTKKVVKL